MQSNDVNEKAPLTFSFKLKRNEPIIAITSVSGSTPFLFHHD
ncbi:hypothetical protein B4135_3271 [Caldibacillus debilis]|uniref:Uncharacterized protein n=1 Tax=Caldibacillus debilis TaxID=301148 RepID=A0A150LGT9_9BACI|nr:hypothetical protein B4135_3271 [Caldibacillus debilis]